MLGHYIKRSLVIILTLQVISEDIYQSAENLIMIYLESPWPQFVSYTIKASGVTEGLLSYSFR